MADVVLKYSSPDGADEIFVERGRVSFGRGSEADYRFSDDGLSRLHATVYQEGGRVWVVDENSTNGTFVNGAKVGPSGTPLNHGDSVKIGNHTTFKVEFLGKSKTAAKPTATAGSKTPQTAAAGANPSNSSPVLIPLLVTGFAVLIIGISAVFIGVTVFGNNNTEVAQNIEDDDEPIENENRNKTDGPDASPTPKSNTKSDKTPGTVVIENNSKLTDSPEAKNQGNNINLPAGKKYQEMSDGEKRQYIAVKAEKVAALIGNRSSGDIPALAIDRIKGFLDAYAKRVSVARMGGCRFGDNLQATYERASKNAPFIIHAFNQEGVDPQIGMYLAMIESEHCVCLQSPTGPLGMFQFTKATGETYGLKTFKGASPSNPDERCQPEPAARAAAKYMKFLTGRYGTGPSSVPLAIGSYNSGEGGLSKNLVTALETNEGLPRDFWSMIANGDKLSKQFQSENFKYVPKYFAAAIIGENPPDFGLTLQPLSTYTK